MRKFTFFLSLVVAFITATAQEVTVTSLDQLSNDKTYFIESARCFLMNNTTANAAGISTSTAKNLGTSTVTKDWNDVNQQFKIENIDGNYYLYSVGAAKYVTKDGSWSDDAIDALSMTPSSDNTYNWKFVIGGNGMNSQEPNQLDAGIVVNSWTTEDPGNRYKIVDIEVSTVVVVDYPNEFAEFDQNKCYTVTTTSRGGWAVKDDQFCSTTDASLGDTSNPNDANQQFAILSVDGENYYIYSVGAQKFVNSDGSLVAGVAEPIELADASKVGDCRVRVNFKGYTDKYINLGGEKQMTIDNWSDIDAGNAVAFIEAGEFDPTAALAMLAPQEPEPEVPALEITGYTPTEAVEKLETITITFNDEIEGTFDMMAMSQIYLGSRSNGCSFAVEGNVLTITPFNAITTPGEYGLVIPEGLITRKVNGEKISLNKEITFTVKEAIAALEITGYTPTEAVEKLETITITFNDEIEGTFDMMAMTQIYLGSRSNGCSFAVEGNVLTITPFNAITTPGEYGLVIPEGLITRKVNGEKISLNKEITFTVKEAIAALEITGYTPTEAVEKLETITITFNDEIEGTFDMMAMTQIYLGSRSNGCSFAVEGNVLTITPFNAITTPGEYGLVIPEGLITRKVNGEKISLNKEITFTVKEAIAALEITGYTPTEAVEKLETITITFNDEIEGTFDMMAMTQIYLGSRSNGCSFAVEGNVLTITPFNAITTPGEYGLVIPEGLITRKVNGEKISLNKEITFTVKEAIVEPEPETPATLNETVVFDFANNVWGIQEGLDPVSFAGTKTAGEYTDGTKTIYIDPTANKGQFYYENGYLRIQKPGSKIVLPAFDFAVEKIEVVGHASATSYPSVDMNVYVGSTAVSTACIGSTETYTYEIAADNQAAGNVYELVIGSNGGNYSSVMFITYVKVYPAENKLEAPAFDLASGVYVGEQTVNVHSATTDLEGVTDVTYYYTTDGNEPTVEDEETDGEITITESCTLKVIVEFTYGDKVYVSASSSAEYIITEEVTYHRAVAVESGSYFIVADGNVSTPINGTTLMAKETSVSGDDVTEALYYAITLEETESGYYIKDVNGKYIYNTMMNPNKLTHNTAAPMDAWTIEIADDENSTAMIVCNGYALALQNGVFCTVHIDDVANAVLPTFYGTHATGINEAVVNGEAIESIYDLQGRKIEKVTNGGIYIVNGKKVLVK